MESMVVEGSLTFLQMMSEINRLKQENEQLINERNQWRNDYIELHNKVVNEESISFKDSSLADMELSENFLSNENVEDLGYDLDEYEKAFEEISINYKI
jgi:hypothetical protein